ncbi:MAG TPA: hypothetical protein DD671_05570 [Balneolaceae bacterium]|nr:hypothetical protein [Balneola sp.]HBQ59094.1 hypothetical protein [Balneolaceae bacterium]|tara:strand:+ start:14175 stop:14513 length:339 start_codon:yes stop_codon:yes gene_type:complete
MKTVFPILLALILAGCSNSLTPELENVGTTNIAFALSEDSLVKLWVENSYQSTVKVLVDEFKAEGVYNVQLEMIDGNGDPLPEGLYTYFLETEQHSTSRAFLYTTKNRPGKQ